MLNVLANGFLILLKRNIAVSVVILIVLLIRYFLQRYPKKYTCVLWLLVAVRMVFDISLPEINTASRLHDGAAVVQSFEEKIGWDETQITEEKLVSFAGGNNARSKDLTTSDVSVSRPAVDTYTFSEMVQGVLFLVWLAGIAMLFLIFMISWIRLKKTVKHAVLKRDNIYECDHISSPFVLGIVKMKIYLPFGLTEKEQEYILAHERFHIEKFDQFTRLAATMQLLLYWMNPLVWVSYFCFVRDQEMRCDEAVLSAYGNGIKKEYSSLLLGFAANNRKLMAVPLAFGESHAGKRIKNILKYRNVKKWTSAGIVFVIAAAAVGAIYLTGTKTKDTEHSVLSDDLNWDTEADVTDDSHETDAAGTEGVTGIFAEALADKTLSLEELTAMVESEEWENFVGTQDSTYWERFENLEKTAWVEDSLTEDLVGHYEWDGKEYELDISYWKEDTAFKYGETPNAVDNILITEVQTGDAIGVYHADKRYHANTDIRTFLDTIYDISTEIEMEQVVLPGAPHNIVATLGAYGQDLLFDGFSGNLFVFDGYTPKNHGESCTASWYSAGGIGEWKQEKDDLFLYDGDRLTEERLSGNHIEQKFLENFENDDFYGLLYEYDFEIFTASESGEAGIENYDDMLSKYWVTFLSAGADEPVYMLFFNQDYFSKQQALMYAQSVKKKS